MTRALATGVSLLGLAPMAGAQQPLETETARLPRRGELVANFAYEFQTSSQGKEHALPAQFEYGITDRLNVLIEPVLYTAIRPKVGRNATGLGDLEITFQFLVRDETARLPAFAIAAEEKFPTANNPQIGTRRADFTPYLIASKKFGAFDVHANLGYSFMGKPAGIQVQNTVNVALAIENHVTARFDVMAEVLSTTGAAAGGEGVLAPTAPEIAGVEQVGMVGIRYLIQRRTWFSFGVTYDNTNALLLRPGISIALP